MEIDHEEPGAVRDPDVAHTQAALELDERWAEQVEARLQLPPARIAVYDGSSDAMWTPEQLSRCSDFTVANEASNSTGADGLMAVLEGFDLGDG